MILNLISQVYYVIRNAILIVSVVNIIAINYKIGLHEKHLRMTMYASNA